jgi:hypothetical protein
MMSLVKSVPFVVLLVALSACGGSASGGQGATSPETSSGTAFNPAATNQAKCGACHAPLDPGGHTKEDLEKILKVHEKQRRVALKPDDWRQMIDYLAKK